MDVCHKERVAEAPMAVDKCFVLLVPGEVLLVSARQSNKERPGNVGSLRLALEHTQRPNVDDVDEPRKRHHWGSGLNDNILELNESR